MLAVTWPRTTRTHTHPKRCAIEIGIEALATGQKEKEKEVRPKLPKNVLIWCVCLPACL